MRSRQPSEHPSAVGLKPLEREVLAPYFAHLPPHAVRQVADAVDHYRDRAHHILEFTEALAQAAVRAAKETEGRDAESAERYLTAALDAAANTALWGEPR